MDVTTHIPTIEEFMAAPDQEVAKVAPATLILTTGGTRRHAVLMGISPTSEEYAAITFRQMMNSLALIFRHGVQHIIVTLFTDTNFSEVTPGYRDKLAIWAERWLVNDDVLAQYQELGWQVRMIGAESWPELRTTAEKLAQIPRRDDGPCVWFMAGTNEDTAWDWTLRTLQNKQISTRKEAIRTIFGQDVPPATLYLGSGKPQILISVVPPILIGAMQCYWRQHLGAELDVQTLRLVLYDYAYLRKTWSEDKSGRAEQIIQYAAAWQNPPIIGLGRRLGPFWYPAPIEAPFAAELTGEGEL